MALGRKTGGRKKGSLNKVTKMSKAVVSDLLSDYSGSGKMKRDFDSLEPKDRIAVAEKLMQYVMPRMQSVHGEMETQVRKSVADSLRELSDDSEDTI